MISDTPVVAHHPVLGVAPGPVLWPAEYEVFVPITPRALSILSEERELGPATLTPQLAAIVNAALAATAHDVVMHHPEMAWPVNLRLHHDPPALPTPRISIRRNPDGHRTAPRRQWPAHTSAIARDSTALLGRDPPLDDEMDSDD